MSGQHDQTFHINSTLIFTSIQHSKYRFKLRIRTEIRFSYTFRDFRLEDSPKIMKHLHRTLKNTTNDSRMSILHVTSCVELNTELIKHKIGLAEGILIFKTSIRG